VRTKIRQRGKRWYVSVIDAAGKEHAHGGYRTQREAKAAALELVPRKGGRYTPPSSVTLGDYLTGEWLPSRENADISPNTRDVYRTIVEAWVVPYIGSVPLQVLSARDIDRLYRSLRQRPIRWKSIRNCHVLLNKALGDAVRRGHLAVSPMFGVDPPPADDSVERTAWSAEEARAFLAVAATDRLHVVWWLALSTGARRGELLGITWDDVEDGAVTIRRQVLLRPRSTPGVPRVYVRETTKTRRVRRVRFDETTDAALRAWKATQAEDRLAFGPAWRTDGGLGLEAPWIVTEPTGHVIHPDTLFKRWKAVVKRAGVTPIGLHGARHSYAELALAAGVRLDVVSRQLGHASISTTANVYTHDNDAAAMDAARTVGKVLEGGR
jgi:integrase